MQTIPRECDKNVTSGHSFVLKLYLLICCSVNILGRWGKKVAKIPITFAVATKF
jgi:hypothetical protein